MRGGVTKNRLVTDCSAVIARVSRAEAFACFWIDSDGVYQTDVAAAPRLVALRFQSRFDACWKIIFHQDHVRQPLMMKTGRVDGRLRVHSQTHPV